MGRSVLNTENIKNMKLAATLIVGAIAAPHCAKRIGGRGGIAPQYREVQPQNVGGWQNGYDFSDPAEVARFERDQLGEQNIGGWQNGYDFSDPAERARFERDQMMKNKKGKTMMKKSMPKKMVMPKKMGMQKKMVMPKKMGGKTIVQNIQPVQPQIVGGWYPNFQ